MKKTKIVIPALGLLLLSTAASVSGTVAWFSMNKTVTATGMSVTAKSDSSFLLIGAGNQDITAIQNANTISASAVTANAELYPVAHEAITNTTDADKNTSWYFQYSNDPSKALGSGANALTTKQNPTSADLPKYVLVNTFNIVVAKGGRSVSNLKVDTCTIATDGAAAVNVLVASASGADEFDATNITGANTLATTVTNSAVVPVKVYIYWNGENEAVYTNNAANLKNTTVDITFTYEALAA